MIALGYDIGTRFVKTCIVEDTRILGFALSEAGGDINKTIDYVTKTALDMADLKKRNIKTIGATGYGAEFVKKASFHTGEEYCLAKAVHGLDNTVNMVVDIGGLFIHVVTINNNGSMSDHCKNDICAAGSGKFLEMISEAVGIPISSISEYALNSSNPYSLTNSCAVFAESEVITQVNAGADNADIIAGVIYSIASKTETLINRIGTKDKLAVVGGVAKIEAFQVILEKVLGTKITRLSVDYQIAAAYGAALHALNRPKKRWWLK